MTTPVISREEAIAQGVKRYFTGHPCNNGHVAERYVVGNRCLDCDRAAAARSASRDGPVRKLDLRSSGAPRATPGIIEPEQWAYDGGKRREPVLDEDFYPPRVVRYVGWRCCMKCAKTFFSADMVRVRLCPPCHNRIESPW